MNSNLQKLFEIAQKPERIILGLMSGTSLDGLDLALCKISGKGLTTQVNLLEFHTYPYPLEVKDKIKTVFSKETVSLQQLCLLHTWLGKLHAAIILETLKKWNFLPQQVDAIASHGQTIYHAPKRRHQLSEFPNATLQIGEADHIAYLTGILTISDFRQKHVAAGGEGAPLVPYGDYMLFSHATENRILLNIGGMANFTYLPSTTSKQKITASDTGPGNTLIDLIVQKHFAPFNYDQDGEIAKGGEIHAHLLENLLSHPFFKQSFPKSTGSEMFNWHYINQALQLIDKNIAPADLVATLTKLTAITIAESIKNIPKSDTKIFVSGGGYFNKTLISWIKNELRDYKIDSSLALGILPEAKEAILFALLANQTLIGDAIEIPGMLKVSLGKISLPT